MLRDGDDPMDLSELVPACGMAGDPVPTQLDTLLDADVLFQCVKADLARRSLAP